MTAKNPITDLLSAPLSPDWTVEGLAEQVLGAIAAQRSEETQEFVLDTDATTDRQFCRLLRPLLACFATKSAAEAGTPANLYGGHFSFKRPGPKGPVWILGQFENRPGSVRVTLRRSSSPPEGPEASPGQPAALAGTVSWGHPSPPNTGPSRPDDRLAAPPEGQGEMATPDDSADDIFRPGGRLRTELLTQSAFEALNAALRLTRETRWDSVRTPHVFMGLLAVPDASVAIWGERLQADLSKLLSQFQELFHQEEGDHENFLALNREFMSDNVIRLLRESHNRATDHHRDQITPMDLLISLLTASDSIVAECFERIGLTSLKFAEEAVIAEHASGKAEG